jgi:hypothetical protein
MVAKYQKRISGPLLDRIDIHIQAPRVEYKKLSDSRLGESSVVIRQRVEKVHQRQRKRFSESGGAFGTPDGAPFALTHHQLLRRHAPGGGAKVLPARRHRAQPDEDHLIPIFAWNLASASLLSSLT